MSATRLYEVPNEDRCDLCADWSDFGGRYHGPSHRHEELVELPFEKLSIEQVEWLEANSPDDYEDVQAEYAADEAACAARVAARAAEAVLS